MKPEKAIEIIKDHFPSGAMSELCEALNIAIESTEKQVAKKLINYSDCTVCGYLFVDDDYCPRCGQKADWEE